MGAKSGMVYGLDPDQQGRIVWENKLTSGGPQGGIMWGAAADDKIVYFAVSDWDPGKPEAGGGLVAIAIATGNKLWSAPAPKPACLGTPGCSAAQPAPLTLVPGVLFAGSRPIGQAILLDDENLQNFWNKGMGSVIGSSLGVEAIAEFQTLTNTYSAQFGGNGGVINAVSKSGTNSYHGSAYEFLRNSALDARSFIDPSQKPAYRQNQFGGSLGGPVNKDRAFFFANYEGIRLTQGESKLGNVPGCNLPEFQTNCVPTATDPKTAQAIANTLKLWPGRHQGSHLGERPDLPPAAGAHRSQSHGE